MLNKEICQLVGKFDINGDLIFLFENYVCYYNEKLYISIVMVAHRTNLPDEYDIPPIST